MSEYSPINKPLSTAFNEEAPVNELLITAFNEEAPINELLSTAFNEEAPVNELLSAAFNEEALVNELLSDAFNEEALVNELLSDAFSEDITGDRKELSALVAPIDQLALLAFNPNIFCNNEMLKRLVCLLTIITSCTKDSKYRLSVNIPFIFVNT